MKLTANIGFEIGHKDTNEWLGFAIPVMAGAIIVVGLVIFLIP